MKVIILGSTGMIGRGVLLEAIDEPLIEKILIINRNSIGTSFDKTEEIVHSDFFNFAPLTEQIKGYDAVLFCLGVSAAGLDEEAYTRITYDITVSFADKFLELNPGSVFCYVSGAGTDSSEKGRFMWARVKGKTENRLLAMEFNNSFMFRPGFVMPRRGVRSRTRLYRFIYTVLWPVFYLLKPFKGAATDTVTLGRAMIRCAISGYPASILSNKDINNSGASPINISQ